MKVIDADLVEKYLAVLERQINATITHPDNKQLQKDVIKWILREIRKGTFDAPAAAEVNADGLLPCPFCNSPPSSHWVGGGYDCGYWAVECPVCNGSRHRPHIGVHGDEQDECERLWNTRAPAGGDKEKT